MCYVHGLNEETSKIERSLMRAKYQMHKSRSLMLTIKRTCGVHACQNLERHVKS